MFTLSEPQRVEVCPYEESNLNHRLRRPVLYPLSYRGSMQNPTDSADPDRNFKEVSV